MEDLEAIDGWRRHGRTIADMDFLETLARWKCILVPPWILELHPDGVMRRVARITYDLDMNLDKAGILLEVIDTLGAGEGREGGEGGKGADLCDISF